MWRVTVKGLVAKKLRFVATALAVILGIGFMSGTLILTDTIKKTFDNLFASVNKGTDAVVRGQKILTLPFGGGDLRRNVPETLIARIEGVPGVAAAEGGVTLHVQIIGRDHKAVGNPRQGAPTFGFNWNTVPALNPFQLQPGGRAPRSDDEIVIDRGSAGKGHLIVGDRTPIITRISDGKHPKTYRIVGIAKFGSADSPAGASVTLFTLHEAERISGDPGQLDAISVVAKSGVSQDELRTRLTAALPQQRLDVITGAAFTKQNQSDIEKNLSFFNVALLAFAAIALIVGVFVIYNSFSIIIAQRTRELALLRAIGATGGQVLRSVLVESAVVGAVASAVGLLAGIGLASGLKALLGVIGFEIPGGSTVLATRTIVVSLVLGTAITVLSALIPARRAARVPPIAAMRDVAVERTRGFARRAAIGVLVMLIGIGITFLGLYANLDNHLLIVGGGIFLLVAGAFVTGPVLTKPVSSLVGNRGFAGFVVLVGALGVLGGVALLVMGIAKVTPAAIIGGPVLVGAGALLFVTGRAAFTMVGGLARENARRNPRRTAVTAAALMIGVGLVGFITIFGASAKASVRQTVSGSWKADYFVFAGSFSPQQTVGVPTAVAAEIGKLPIVSAATGISASYVSIDGVHAAGETAFRPTKAAMTAHSVAGADTAELPQLLDTDVRSGSIGAIGSDGIGVQLDLARSNHWRVGDVLRVRTTRVTRALTIRAIYGLKNQSETLVNRAVFTQSFPQVKDLIVYIKVRPGVTEAAARKAIGPDVKPYANAQLLDRGQFIGQLEKQIDQFVNLIYAMLFLAVIISAIGIVNTLALSIFERTRELGLMRAVGMTRAQLRGAIRWEAVIIAMFGTAIGLALGLFAGWAFYVSLADQGFNRFAAAPEQLLIVVGVASVLGVFAGAWPALRASRLDILQAIATE
jgi:putative ABC transport system permease protein